MRKKNIFTVLLILITVALLALCCRDLMHFEYSFLGKRSFEPETDRKGMTVLSESFTLKPGNYELVFYGEVQGPGSMVCLVREENDVFTGFDLEEGTDVQKESFTVSGASENLRIGLNYDPEHSAVYSRKISVVSGNVLYKSSLLRHGAVSLFILAAALIVLIRIWKPEWIFRLFPVFREKQNETDFLLIILFSLILSAPLLIPDSFGLAEDIFFHLSRIEGISEGIRSGYFPVRNELFWLKNYGYGTGYFYPDLFLYFPACLRLLGFSLLGCYKIFMTVCTFFSLCTFYITGKLIFRSRSAARGAAVLFGFSTYRAIALFYRSAVGELQSFIFLPLIVLGLYCLFNGHPERWWVFALGFWGVLSSHVISLVLAGCVTAVYLLIRLRAVFRDKRILTGILKAALLVVFLGAGFLLPMLEQMNGNSLNMNILISEKRGGLQQNNISSVKNLLVFFHDWHYDSNLSRIVYPGWMMLAVPLLRIILLIRKKPVPKAADIMLAAGMVLMICSTKLFPWKYLVWFLNRIQFAWRLLVPSAVLLSLCGGAYLSCLASGKNIQVLMGCLIVMSMVCVFPIYRDTVVNRTVPEDEFIMQDNRVAGMEYMPDGLSPEFIDKNRDTVGTEPENITILSHKRRGLSFTFSFDYSGEDPWLYFTVPLIRYHGYRGVFTDGNGSSAPLEIERSEDGLVLVRLPACSGGTVSVSFHKTPYEITGEIITLLTVFGVLGYSLLKRRSGTVSA